MSVNAIINSHADRAALVWVQYDSGSWRPALSFPSTKFGIHPIDDHPTEVLFFFQHETFMIWDRSDGADPSMKVKSFEERPFWVPFMIWDRCYCNQWPIVRRGRGANTVVYQEIKIDSRLLEDESLQFEPSIRRRTPNLNWQPPADPLLAGRSQGIALHRGDVNRVLVHWNTVILPRAESHSILDSRSDLLLGATLADPDMKLCNDYFVISEREHLSPDWTCINCQMPTIVHNFTCKFTSPPADATLDGECPVCCAPWSKHPYIAQVSDSEEDTSDPEEKELIKAVQVGFKSPYAGPATGRKRKKKS